MKLGTQTNSFTNHVYARSTRGQPDPEVGMGATILCWTDRHAATIVAVGQWRGSTLLDVQRDYATRIDKNGMSECQTYEYHRNTFASIQRFWWDKKRMVWREVNEADGHKHKVKKVLSKPGQGRGLMIGVRREYHDFSF